MTSMLQPFCIVATSSAMSAMHRLKLGRCAFHIMQQTLTARVHQQPHHSTITYCYQLLEVEEECDYMEVREAYLRLAKQYHPDSSSGKASASKFALVKDAYQQIVKHRCEKGKSTEDEENQMIVDIKHTAPQHRQYLSYEGVGFGTPSQRQRQYQQYKVMRAADNVYEYRTEKMAAEYENALALKDKKATRKQILRNAMDRLVEDLISESMAKGEFENLPGQGKPLNYSNHNPLIDTATHNLNKILIENGYVPEWVTLQKEISQGMQKAQADLLKERMKLGPAPLTLSETQKWDAQLLNFHGAVEVVNAKISKMNMVTPSLVQQKVPFRVDREVRRVMAQYADRFERGETEAEEAQGVRQLPPIHSSANEKHSMRMVWEDVKELFLSRKVQR